MCVGLEDVFVFVFVFVIVFVREEEWEIMVEGGAHHAKQQKIKPHLGSMSTKIVPFTQLTYTFSNLNLTKLNKNSPLGFREQPFILSPSMKIIIIPIIVFIFHLLI